MRRSLVLAGAVGLGMAGVLGAVALGARHPESPEADVRSGAAEATPLRAAPRRTKTPSPDAPPSRSIDALIAEGTPGAWGRVAALYPGSDEATKRKVLASIGKLPELHRVIGYLLATVGEDPTPPGDDPLVNEASALIRSRFGKFEDYEYGRRTMVMQKTDKRRWLLANALIDYAKPLRDDAYAELKGTLQAKLIDVHSQVRDAFVQNGMVEGVRALGAADAALILEKKGKVTDRELMAVAEENAAARQVLAEADAR